MAAARFHLATALPLAVAWGLWHSPQTAWLLMLGVQAGLALLELLPGLRHSPPSTHAAGPWHRAILRLHVPLQFGLLAWGLWVVLQPVGLQPGERPVEVAHAVMDAVPGAVLAGLAVGGVCGAVGITFAHELGHSRSRLDRLLAWLLMGSVLYAHFMVEHYRGHHPRAATPEDPATARRGESVWRFLPRTVGGGWRSAWALEATQRRQLRRSWWGSPLAWATAAQLVGVVLLMLVLGPLALLFWVVQAAYAVLLLETINYIEHYGLVRPLDEASGRRAPFGVQHAWNADHAISNAVLANLQRHSDHHLHAWKAYPTLDPLPGPQLPTGYAGCVFLAWLNPLWRRLMAPRLDAMSAEPLAASPGGRLA